MKLSIAFAVLASTCTVRAFQQPASPTRKITSLNTIALNPFGNNKVAPPQPEEPEKKDESSFDMTGIAVSGLNGKVLQVKPEDFPEQMALRAVIPNDCFEIDTATSLGYLSVSVVGTAICSAIGVAMLGFLPPENVFTWPIWTAYSAVTGTVAMGLWVLAHECGHGAFSKNKTIQDTVGYVLHSLFLVPYYSWQRSHAVHHRYTNHMELGETHVPEAVGSTSEGSIGIRSKLMETFGRTAGIRMWGVLQGFLHLVVGWPAYLLIGATGGPDRGLTNHYWPDPLTEPNQPKKELFPGKWKEKVFKSDIGVAFVAASAIAWAACNGIPQMMALYGGPLIVVNAWLVLYTWLQHTDVDVPHFSDEDHNFVKGALHTIDRPYDKLDPFGAINFLHHNIGTTHVAHHFDSSIPHYNAQKATDAIKEAYPDLYFYDPTPIPEAVWRICKGCSSVEKRDDKWVWNNEGVEDLL
ncbi:unnamed protein product [Cylindrotheca closterium]|uniref:Fatty acid desaturase domain-containing protein n=1 Tax=Cylindrotheca closterium TaxID=2856 RepID=A0AAD2FQ74_9STRA|nr:unnamed protein product [Cylindrotheca closterium]